MSIAMALREADPPDRALLVALNEAFEPIESNQKRITSAKASLSTYKTTHGIIRAAKFERRKAIGVYQDLLDRSRYGEFTFSDLVELERLSLKVGFQISESESFTAKKPIGSSEDDLTIIERVQLGITRDLLQVQQTAVARIEKVRADARLAHSLRTRHLIKDINVLDLPNEILLRIARFVDSRTQIPVSTWSSVPQSFGYNIPSWACTEVPLSYQLKEIWDTSATRDLKAFQNLRLTCRQLATLCAPLLIPSLSIETSPDSLDRLQQVSRQSLIANGVRCVQLRATTPCRLEWTVSLAKFAARCLLGFEYMKSRLDVETQVKIAPDSEDAPGSNVIISSNHMTELQCARQKITDLITACEALRFPQIVHSAHEQFLQRVADHWAWANDPTLASTISAAIGRMPQARRLYMTNDQRSTFKDKWNPYGDLNSTINKLLYNEAEGVRCLANWACGKQHASRKGLYFQGDPSVELHLSLIQTLPIAMMRSNAPLKELHIALYSHLGKANRCITDEGLEALREACQGLNSFAIRDYTSVARYSDSRFTTQHLGRACMGSQALQYLGVEAPAPSAIGRDKRMQFLASVSVSKIKVLELQDFAIRPSEFSAFLARLPGKITIIVGLVELIGDESWFELVEHLRAKCDARSSTMGSLFGHWSLAPEHWMEMSLTERQRVLNDYILRRRDPYLMGGSDRNPFLPPLPLPEEQDDSEDQEQSATEGQKEPEENTDEEEEDEWNDEMKEAGLR